MPQEVLGDIALGSGLMSAVALIVYTIWIAVDRNSAKKDLQRMKIDQRIEQQRKQYEVSATKRLEEKIQKIDNKINSIKNARDLNELLPDAPKSKSFEHTDSHEKTINREDE